MPGAPESSQRALNGTKKTCNGRLKSVSAADHEAFEPRHQSTAAGTLTLDI